MARVATVQTSFNTGEISPLVEGRIDQDRYKSACALVENYLPLLQGPLTRRPGTYFVANVKNPAAKIRLQAFRFSNTEAYMLEMGNNYIRFYKDQGQILLGGVPYELVTPYTTADVFQLKFTQSFDVLYVTHPNYPPAKILRFGDTDWAYQVISFQDGPYIDQSSDPGNQVNSPGGPSPLVFTWTTNETLNDGAGLSAADVGRLMRFQVGAQIYWGKIATVPSSQTATLTLEYPAGATVPAVVSSVQWQLGAFGVTPGYPAAIMFHENRLCFSGVPASPEQVYCSNTNDYENMAPTQSDGTVIDSNALNFGINSEGANYAQWITSSEKGMLLGTTGGEWGVKPALVQAALTPTDVTAKMSTNHGSANVQPVQVGKATLFLQSAGRKIRELAYYYDVDGYRATDLTKISEHITLGGVTQMALQREPQPYVWMPRGDGQLLCMGYEREQDSLVVSWSRHILGNGGSAYPAVVESVAVIPTPDGTSDELWLSVLRYINGSYVRFVEYMTPMFVDGVLLRNAFFVDAGLTLDVPVPIQGFNATGTPCIVNSTAHGFVNGDVIRIQDVVGLDLPINPPKSGINDIDFVVVNAMTNSYALTALNATTYSPYVSGGEARKLITTVSGLSHLIGMTVQILADGVPRADQIVSGGGTITLNPPASVVQVGMGYSSKMQTLRSDAGAADGTAMGKTRRIQRFGLLLQNSLGLAIGPSFDKLKNIIFTKTSDLLNRQTALKSQVFSETIDMDYNFDNTVCVQQSQPLPSTILAVFPQFETQDR